MPTTTATTPANPDQPAPQLMPWWGNLLMGVYLVLLASLLLFTLGAVWPGKLPGPDEADVQPSAIRLFGKDAMVLELSHEVRLIFVVAVAGALGSFVHSATSFATYVGNRSFHTSWVWWYLLRTPIGVVLAVLFYFVVRGGLLSAGASGSVLSPFGLAATAGLVGMFSKQAADKLREVFDNLFRTEPGKGDEERKDKPVDDAPAIVAFEPAMLAVNSTNRLLKITGSNFGRGQVVRVNGVDRATTFVSATELQISLDPADVAGAGTLMIAVSNPQPDGRVSEPRSFEVR